IGSVAVACVDDRRRVFVRLSTDDFSVPHLQASQEVAVGDLRGLAVPQTEMTLDEDLAAGLGKSLGLECEQFVLGEEKRGQALIALATLMFVARPRDRRA